MRVEFQEDEDDSQRVDYAKKDFKISEYRYRSASIY